MNLTYIHSIAQKTLEKELKMYYIRIDNPVFDLDQEYMQNCLDQATVELGRAIMKAAYKEDTLTTTQMHVAKKISEDYKEKATRLAVAYFKEKCKL